MDLKAIVIRTRTVSGLYGDDLVIVKPDRLNHESLLHGRHCLESLDQYGATPWRSPLSGH
jgi:hypothetical protein